MHIYSYHRRGVLLLLLLRPMADQLTLYKACGNKKSLDLDDNDIRIAAVLIASIVTM